MMKSLNVTISFEFGNLVAVSHDAKDTGASHRADCSLEKTHQWARVVEIAFEGLR
jgi:hypothetical protein